ncbi:MAG: class I SAM-dependent methyltransferase [Pseudomonadota bacterium]
MATPDPTLLADADANGAPGAITAQQAAQIQAIPHLAQGSYANLDIDATLRFYKRRYVDQLAAFTTLTSKTVIADAGAGYGWLAIAFARYTPAKVVAMEAEPARAEAGRAITSVLGLDQRITWHAASLGARDGEGRSTLPPISADVTYCIEVLEHVQRNRDAVRDLVAMTKRFLIITTPNLWFPVVAHDTRLPFCHQLPLPARQAYAKLFKRQDRENDNLFWSVPQLERLLPGFTRRSSFLHYASYEAYLETHPFYLPYNGGMTVGRPGALKRAYYRAAASLGRRSAYVMPNLAGVFERTG